MNRREQIENEIQQYAEYRRKNYDCSQQISHLRFAEKLAWQ